MPHQGILFILVGPSGAGKNTLMKPVQDYFNDLPQLATVTTRDPRAGEQAGREHVFATHAEFQALINSDALIEYQNVHVDDFYGTPRHTVEEALNADHDLIADIESLGAAKIRAAYPDNSVLIFVTPSNLETLARRIQQRGDVEDDERADRLERARFELAFAPQCDYMILNDIAEPATEHLRQIILTERARRRGRPESGLLERPAYHSYVVALVQRGDQLLVESQSKIVRFPTFPLTEDESPTGEVLEQHVRQAFGPAVAIQGVEDRRFDFVAPHYISIAAIPNDIYLYFYYKCILPLDFSGELPGWQWQPAYSLNLPAILSELLVPTL